MVTQDEINGYFLEIIRFLKSEFGYTQEYIVEKAKLGKNAISKVKNGHNNVGDETIKKLCDAFALNPDFFYGRSPYKTLLEKSEAAMMEELRNLNKSESPKTPESLPLPSADVMSLYIENAVKAATSYADKHITFLEAQVAEKDKQLQQQADIIADLIKTIKSIQPMLPASAGDLLKKYPFEIGVADNPDSPRTQV